MAEQEDDIIEIWKPIQRFENLYEVSNLGRVKSLAKVVSIGMGRYQKHEERIMSICASNNGYLTFRMHSKDIKVTSTLHRVVAKHFIPNPNNLPVVNHIDGNKLNCAYWNLEWNTHSQNALHAYATGLRVGAWIGIKGLDHYKTKPVMQFNQNGELVKEWPSSSEAGKELNILSKGIRNVCDVVGHTYKGFAWKYKQ